MKIGNVIVKMGDKVFSNGKVATLQGMYNGLVNVRYEDGTLDQVKFDTLKSASKDEIKKFKTKDDIDGLLEQAKELKVALAEHAYLLSVVKQEVKLKNGE